MDKHDFFEIVYRIINKYNLKTKKPHHYGTNYLLYNSEIHMIEVIGKHQHLTAKAIASLQGITKGAVSQTTNKLLQKELIKKEFSPNGNNEILISLTRQGEIAFENHLTFHNEMIQQSSMLAIDLPEESLEIIKKMLNTIDKILDTY